MIYKTFFISALAATGAAAWTQELSFAPRQAIFSPIKRVVTAIVDSTKDSANYDAFSQAAETSVATATSSHSGTLVSGETLSILILLAVIGLILAWRSSRHKKQLDDVRSELEKQKEQLENLMKQHEELILKVGKKIQEPASEIIHSSKKISQHPLDPMQSKELSRIRYSDELLLDITHDLIEFLNIKSGKVKILHEPFNINNVLDEVAGLVTKRARGSRVELIFNIEKDVPGTLKGDPLKLGQVLTNILSNAMKFTEEGEVELHVYQRDKEKNRTSLCFEISDTGTGIDPDRLDQIFIPFSPVNPRNETGLGLFIAKSYVEKMGGEITVQSRLGHGSTFRVILEFEIPNPKERRHYPLPSKSYTGHSVLIVEPNERAGKALKTMMERFKNHVTLVKPHELLQDPQPLLANEVVIIAESGFDESLRKLVQKHKDEMKGKVVLAGSMVDEPHTLEALEPIIDARIMKPLTTQRIYDLILVLFKDSQKRSSSPKKAEPHTVPATHQDYEEVPEKPGVKKEDFKRFAGASLLIVEDNLINQKVLASLLQESGIAIDIAENGKIAVEKVKSGEKDYDLVLMDINMPVMDGYEATRRIRKLPKGKNLPVVSLTGLGLAEEIAKMYATGMNAHLLKPLKVGQLYTVFERFLPSRQPEEDTSDKPQEERIPSDSEYLKVSEGLARANDNLPLYSEILKDFTQLYQQTPKLLQKAIAEHNYKEIIRLCLDIEGMGANIGAYALAQSARKLRQIAAEKDYDKAAELLNDLVKVLGATIEDADRVIRYNKAT